MKATKTNCVDCGVSITDMQEYDGQCWECNHPDCPNCGYTVNGDCDCGYEQEGNS